MRAEAREPGKFLETSEHRVQGRFIARTNPRPDNARMTGPDDPGLARLLDEAAVRAEATIARLRVATAFVCGGALLVFAIGPALLYGARVPWWLIVTAAVTLACYLALAIARLRFATPGWIRPWMSFVSVGLEASLLAVA